MDDQRAARAGLLKQLRGGWMVGEEVDLLGRVGAVQGGPQRGRAGGDGGRPERVDRVLEVGLATDLGLHDPRFERIADHLELIARRPPSTIARACRCAAASRVPLASTAFIDAPRSKISARRSGRFTGAAMRT